MSSASLYLKLLAGLSLSFAVTEPIWSNTAMVSSMLKLYAERPNTGGNLFFRYTSRTTSTSLIKDGEPKSDTIIVMRKDVEGCRGPCTITPPLLKLTENGVPGVKGLTL